MDDTKTPPPGHGTRTGYNRHLKAGEPACYHCLEAQRVYSAARRARDGGAESRRYPRARYKATSELARRHPNEYRTLLAAALAVERSTRRKNGDRP